MPQLLKPVLAIFSILALLCLSATVIGRIQPMGPIVPGLDICQGRLCYLGITVGKTTWDQAQEIIKKSPGFTLDSEQPGAYIAGGTTRRLTVFYDPNSAIFEADLLFRPLTVPVSSFLTHWGVPCAIYSLHGNGVNPYQIVLRYSNQIVWANANMDWYIQPSSSVGAVEMYRGNPSNFFPCNGSLDNATRYNWRGFTRYPFP